MRIEIEIPKNFEEHFNQDKFKDSFERIMADIKYYLKNEDCLCSGKYEYETIEMLQKAFKNSRQAYDIDKVVEELEERKALHERLVDYETKNGTVTEKYQHIKAIDVLNETIEIIKQNGISDDVYEKIQIQAYNKAIDDFVKMAYDELLYNEHLTEIDINYIAEQLKVGANNDKSI